MATLKLRKLFLTRSLGNSADDVGADDSGNADRQSLPQGDQALFATRVGTHVLCRALANIILPDCRMGNSSPLRLEFIGTTTGRAAAKIKGMIAAVNAATD